MSKQLKDTPEAGAVYGGAFFEPPLSVEELARKQGVKPFDFDELLTMEERGPADESIDDFISVVREWRGEGKDRSLP